MSNYSFTPLARQDLFEIYDYIALNNFDAAEQLLKRFSQKFELLATMPFSGKSRIDLGENIRCVSEGRYLIFYEPNSMGIQILRILHGSRNIEAIFEQDN